MKKKLIIGLCVIAINLIAFSTLNSAPSIPAEEWHWYTIYSCNCETGEKDDEGWCDLALCEDNPIWHACTDDIPCGPCLTPE